MMRHFAMAFAACVVVVGGSAYAQPGVPAPAPSDARPFSGSDLLTGKRVTDAECASTSGAVWVVVEGQGECIRYYHSDAGGVGSEALVYFASDPLVINSRGEARANDSYVKETPAGAMQGSAGWSRNLRMPHVYFARPGTYGSSGEHAKRRLSREIELVSAALDKIKENHGYQRLHLAGYGEGAHTAAALLPRRTDLGCVVLASGLLSLRGWLKELGRTEDFTGSKNSIDPIDLVDRIAKRAELRIFVVTDPDDIVISARSQTVYAKRLASAGLPVRQIFAAAPDPGSHFLPREARQIAAACAKGTSTDAIVARYENKKPETPPDADDPPLHGPATLTQGVVLNEQQCNKLPTALWVRVDGRDFCVRYWMSTAGGNNDEPLVYVHGDIGGADKGKISLNVYGAKVTSGHLQRDAHRWSRSYRGPYIIIGRPGAFGSSGNHLRDRRLLLEARVVAAALDALRARHGFKRFHMVGQSGGGHTVAALSQQRGDLGCAVMTSGTLSVKSFQRDLGRPLNTKVRSSYDPIDFVHLMDHQPGRRMVVMSDPRDRRVSDRSQREFVERVKAKGLPILHVTASAGDPEFHGLSSAGLRLAIDCIRGVDDEALLAKYRAQPAPVAAR